MPVCLNRSWASDHCGIELWLELSPSRGSEKVEELPNVSEAMVRQSKATRMSPATAQWDLPLPEAPFPAVAGW